jgi:uncharacterized protein (DUF488 family)
MAVVFTVGHSTRSIEEFVELLKINVVERLIDVRTVPHSRHNPQFEQTALKKSLPGYDVEYMYMKELGGLRPKAKNSANMGWHNESFRNYADYMQTEAFAEGIEKLIKFASQKPTAIMCAEAVPWRCHRSLIGDALLVRNVRVCDIMSKTSTKDHTLTSLAVSEGKKLTYPSDNANNT